MPSAPNTKSTASVSEDTSSDGNGENAPFPHGLTGRLQCSAPPTSAKVGAFLSVFPPTFWRHRPCTTFYGIPSVKGWGIYGNFLPYLPEALPLYGPLRHPTSKGMGIFRAFYPYLLDCTRPLLHSLSDFKISPSDHQAGLPYTTAPFSVRNSLASACRTAGGLFLYRTENRLKVIEF